MTGSRRTPPTPTPLPVTRQQAEAEVTSATATTSDRENLNLGAATAIIALSVLLGWLCLPNDAKHPGNARLNALLLLSFATFLTGSALVMLSFNMLGLREQLISTSQRVAARCLRTACPVMLVLTLLSLLLPLLRGGVYLYIGLAFVTVVVPAAARVYCYLRRRAGGGGNATDEEQKKLDDALKITSSVTTSAFGGIVGVLFSVSKISAGAAGAGGLETAAIYSAIFFMFATAILGMFVTTVSKKVPEIGSLPCRKLFITGVKLANAFLLCTLASAALAASFVVSRYRILAAFAPLVVTATVSFLLKHCVARRRRLGGGGDGAERRENHEARIKAMEGIASSVMMAALGGIMSILGGWLGEKDHAKWGAMDMFMVVLTSVFVSSFGFMVLAAAPGAAMERLAPVATVLISSTVALFAATAVAVYGVEVSELHSP